MNVDKSTSIHHNNHAKSIKMNVLNVDIMYSTYFIKK